MRTAQQAYVDTLRQMNMAKARGEDPLSARAEYFESPSLRLTMQTQSDLNGGEYRMPYSATPREGPLVSRKKNVTEGGSGVNLAETIPIDMYEGTQYEDAAYQHYLNKQQNNILNDLSTAGLMAEKTGNVPQSQYPRSDAEYDPYLGTVVNYNALSPRTLKQLVNMGVNRPETTNDFDPEDNASNTLMALLNLYRYGMENGLYK